MEARARFAELLTKLQHMLYTYQNSQFVRNLMQVIPYRTDVHNMASLCDLAGASFTTNLNDGQVCSLPLFFSSY